METKLAEAGAAIADLNEEVTSLVCSASNADAQAQAAAVQAKFAASMSGAVLQAQANFDGAKYREVVAAKELAAQARSTAELDAVDTVLGLRGVRAHLLGRALGGIEAQAQAWLARLGGLGLSLKPYAEKADGGIADSISLEVGGRPYRAASGGERRRVDVALMLALAETASGAERGGMAPDVLLFDEVLDALDADGAAAVGAAIQSLALDRAVLVITHSAVVGEAFGAAILRLRVEGGRVSVS
jgi:DNA repair exonuclease SbcCD ATPase subunit